MSIHDQGKNPNAQESLSNVQLALKQESVSADSVRFGLDNLIKEIKAAKDAGNKNNASDNQSGFEITLSDLSRVGISLDSLQHIEQKLLAKQSQFDGDFPHEQAGALTEMIRQIEKNTEQEPAEQPVDAKAEAIMTNRESSKNKILTSIQLARKSSELRATELAIEDFEDQFVVLVKPGDEKDAAIKTYNDMSRALTARKNELATADRLLGNIQI